MGSGLAFQKSVFNTKKGGGNRNPIPLGTWKVEQHDTKPQSVGSRKGKRKRKDRKRKSSTEV